MSATINVGDLVYDITTHFTKISEFGVSLMAVMQGQVMPPASGARFDIAFEGVAKGPRIKGKVAGVDYLYIRADGHEVKTLRAIITTEDGANISFEATGVTTPIKGGDILEAWTATHFTSHPNYTWVNELPVWMQGKLSIMNQRIDIKGYTTS